MLFKRPLGTIITPSPRSVSCLCALFCSAPKVFYSHLGRFFFFFFCAPRIQPRMRNIPRGSPAFPDTEDVVGQTPATGAKPHTHVGTCRRTNAGGNMPAPLRASNTRRRSRQRPRLATNMSSSPLPTPPPVNAEPPPAMPKPAATRPAKWWLPAVQTPAAAHPLPFSPHTRAAGFTNAENREVTDGRPPCPPLPTPCATAGNTDTGGNTPAPFFARHAHRRSSQRRRRSRNK